MLYSADGLDTVSGCKIVVRKSSRQYGKENASFAFTSANDSDYEEDYNQVTEFVDNQIRLQLVNTARFSVFSLI